MPIRARTRAEPRDWRPEVPRSEPESTEEAMMIHVSGRATTATAEITAGGGSQATRRRKSRHDRAAFRAHRSGDS
eukprot:4629972-Pleurochrysis_carterae.AAC.1